MVLPSGVIKCNQWGGAGQGAGRTMGAGASGGLGRMMHRRGFTICRQIQEGLTRVTAHRNPR